MDRETRDEMHNLEQQTVRSVESGDYDEAYTLSYVDPEQRYIQIYNISKNTTIYYINNTSGSIYIINMINKKII